MHGWTERQRLLREYEASDRLPRRPGSVESLYASLDEMRALSVRLGYRPEADWFASHLAVHERVREGLRALHFSRLKG